MKYVSFPLLLLLVLLAGACGPEQLTLSLESQEASKGEQICIPVRADRFENILTMQYSIGWDEKVLQFSRVADFALPSLTANNFGRPAAYPGRLTVAWFEPNLQAVTVPDGTTLFTVCFQVVGEAGAGTSLSIQDDPTVVEIANIQEEVLKPSLKAGEVRVK